MVACETLAYSLLPYVILVGVWTFKKTEGQAAKDGENNNYMQQQQVSSLQIRALGALCRVLSQVWRERIALAIPRLQKVWTKYEANLFCAELERGRKKPLQEYALVCLSSLCGSLFTMRTSDFDYFLFHRWFNNWRLYYSKGFQRWIWSRMFQCKWLFSSFFNWVVSDIKSTAKTPDTASKRNPSNPVSSIKSQGQRESVSIGTGITDLGGIGKTNSKQVYYIWRAIFTASTKRTQKVLYLTIWAS